MIVQLVGCSHHKCSVELRELLAISEPKIPATLARFQKRFPTTEAVFLSTCNRTEIYTAGDDINLIPSPAEIAVFLAEQNGVNAEQALAELFQHSGADAIRHLFTVAASLDSMVVGEAQILSQVKRAYQIAADENSAGQLTHAAFQAAIRVAKRVTLETEIHRRRVSIPSVAIGEFASQIFERLDDKSILVIGAGEMSKESIRYLIASGGRDITVVNRNPTRAAEVAQQFAMKTANWDELDQRIIDADLIISTTGSRQPIVDLERFHRIESQRYQRPLFIVDLAVPRDFEPAISDCLGVYLYSIDDLSQACQANLQAREQELPAAQLIIEEETRRFMAELQHRASVPTIRQLRQSAEAIRDAELQRLLQKLAGLEEESRQEIVRSFGRLVNKILHPPLESLKEQTSHQEQAYLLQALRRLFRLRD